MPDIPIPGLPQTVLYAFSIAYLAGPVVGIPVDSAHIVELVHSLPEWAKISFKTLLAAPFAYHAWNGVRHLAWDSVKRKYTSRTSPQIAIHVRYLFRQS